MSDAQGFKAPLRHCGSYEDGRGPMLRGAWPLPLRLAQHVEERALHVDDESV